MALIDRSQHPTLNDNLDFRKDLAKLLFKYKATISGGHPTDLYFTIKDQGTYRLNERGGSHASFDNINGVEDERPKKKRNRKPKNALRRWIYEYERDNPQLGTSIRTAEVYAKTQKQAEKEARRSCNSYDTYGSLYFKRIIKVSDPIVNGVDVKLDEHTYYNTGKTYLEYKDLYPKQHSEGWDILHDITEAD